MDFALTEEQRALQELTREIVGDLATHERLTALEAAGAPVVDRELWHRLAEAGVLAACLPEDHGGLGLLGLGLVCEEVGRAPGYVPVVATLALGAYPLARSGAAPAWLEEVAAGRLLLTAALQEPGETGGLPLTTADEVSSGWRLRGDKTFVPYGAVADRFLVAASTGPDDAALFLVPRDAAGLTVVPVSVTNHEPTADLRLEDVEVPADARVGDAAAVHWTGLVGTAALCALQAGVCDAALRMTARYTSERKQFGSAVASFQAVGQRAADAFVDTELVRLTAYQALWRLAAGWPAEDEVAVAKFWAGDGGSRVVHACQHLHGGIGVDLDYPVHRYFLWTKQIEHTLGTPTRQLLRLGAALAANPV